MKCALPGMYGKPIPRLNIQSNSVADSYSKDKELLGAASKHSMVDFDRVCEQYNKARDDLAKSLSENFGDKQDDLKKYDFPGYLTTEQILEGPHILLEQIQQEILQKDKEEHSQENQSS